MKKVLLIAALAVSSVSFAQTSKSTWMLGGGAGFSSTKQDEVSSSDLTFSPRIGYFVMDNLAVGANVLVNSSKEGDVSSSTTGFGPFVRYYFAPIGKNAKLFGNVDFAFGSSKTGESESVSATQFGVSAGAAFFLNSSIALEAALGYSSLKSNVEGSKPANTIGLNVGFQIHLGK